MVVIHTDTLLKNKLNPLLSYKSAENRQFRRTAWTVDAELPHSAKILVIGILCPLQYDLVSEMLRNEKDDESYH